MPFTRLQFNQSLDVMLLAANVATLEIKTVGALKPICVSVRAVMKSDLTHVQTLRLHNIPARKLLPTASVYLH